MPAVLSPPPAPSGSPVAARARTWLGLPALLTVGVALWDPARSGGPPLCPYRFLTGHTCPGCGLTRAIGALVRGRWHEAVTLHPLAPVVVALVVAGCVGHVLLGDRVRRFVQSPPGYVLVAGLSVALVATWAIRVRSGQIAVLG